MAFSLPKIYPLTDASISRLSHLEQVKQLIAGGADFIQLREKHSSSKDFYESAKAVMDFVRPQNVRIIINDRVDIALAVKADGVHLGQDDISPAQARKILGDSAIIGFSTHSIFQAIEALKLPIDYIAAGPVYQTKTKENPDKVLGIDGLREISRAAGEMPLVAIGGINKQNYQEILENGAASVALISGILLNPSGISQTYKSFVKHL